MVFSRQCEGKVRVNGWWEIFEDSMAGHGARWPPEESGVRERWLHVMQRCDLKFIAKLLCASVLLPPVLNGVQPTVTVPNVCPLPNSCGNGCDSTKRWSFQKGLGRESSSLMSGVGAAWRG